MLLFSPHKVQRESSDGADFAPRKPLQCCNLFAENLLQDRYNDGDDDENKITCVMMICVFHRVHADHFHKYDFVLFLLDVERIKKTIS